MAERLQNQNIELFPLATQAVVDDAVMESPSPGTATVQAFRFTDSPFMKGIKGSVNFTDFVSPSKEGEISMEFSPGSLHKSSCKKKGVNQPSKGSDQKLNLCFKENVKHRRKTVRGGLFSSREESQDQALSVSEDSFIALSGSPPSASVQPTAPSHLFPSTSDSDLSGGQPAGSPSFVIESSIIESGDKESPVKTLRPEGSFLEQETLSSPSLTDKPAKTFDVSEKSDRGARAPVKMSGNRNKSGRAVRGLFQPKDAGETRPLPAGPSLMSLGQTEESFSLNPADIFCSSPRSPDTPVLNLWGAAGGDLQNASLNQTDHSFRRCRSQEIRKNLFDLSNTPPNTYGRYKSMSKRSLFKRPLDIQVKEKSLAKRLREVSHPPTSDLPTPDLPDPAASVTSDRLDNQLSSVPSVPSLPPEVSASDHDRIKSAVDTLQSRDLVADGSRSYCLPVIPGRHQDLINIHHDTMADLLTGEYDDVHDRLTVIDCRYPYEYAGGHIQGAINIYTEKEISEFLRQEIEAVKNTNSVHILVFHCEFSSQRGPSLSRHLRQTDRQMNMMQYPRLTFPELYCLHGGYKDFFLHHPTLCQPGGYVPMSHQDHAAAYLHFRARAKTWAHSTTKHRTPV